MPLRKPFLLRLPPDLLEEIRGWAEQEMRSLNGQIEYLLRDALRRRRGGLREEDGKTGAGPRSQPSA
ncbi:MAG: Arc family DNA-binding protein [Planctomycetota bacterium]